MNDKVFISCISGLIEEINNLNTTIKELKENLYYITKMKEDDRDDV